MNTALETGMPRDDFATRLQSKLSRPQIPALHGIRAIAVFMVIFYHYGLPIPGAHGVLIFFVLSGFLITWLLLRENEKTGRISLSGFYRRRVLRIFPAFYFYWIVLVALLLAAGKTLLWPHAISSFFYLSNYYAAIYGDPNTGFSHTWSLAIEEQFYLMWPLLFVAFRRDLKKLTIFLAGLIGAVWVYRCILYFVFDMDQAYFYAAFDARMDNLMVGCLLAVLLKRGALMNFWRFACRSFVMPLATLTLLIISVFGGPAVFPRYRDIIGLAIDPVLVAIMIVQMIAFSSTSGFKWLDWRVMLFFGEISYSLYLWQQLTIGLARNITGLPMLVHLALAVTLTIIAASFSYYAVERPFLKLKDRHRNKRIKEVSPLPAPAAAPSAAPLESLEAQ